MKLANLYGLGIIMMICCQGIQDKFKCKSENVYSRIQDTSEDSLYNHSGKTIDTRFKTPQGYQRTITEPGSFGSFLRNLTLKPHGSAVLLYDGSIKPGEGNHCAVVNMDIGDKDLQQCADAIIRLRAEYLFENKQFQAISFHFTNGEKADYVKYAEGFRPIDIENNMRWVKRVQRDYSHNTFLDYLELVFTYSGSYSLSRELRPVTDRKDIKVGDVFIQGGFPGHAVIVVDMIKHIQTGVKQVLLAQSYMPAQDIHILVNPTTHSPWYPLTPSGKIITPDWIFDYDDLKRFFEE